MTDQSRIEDDLARTRARMDERLNELQDRLTPSRLATDAMTYLQGSDTGEFASNLLASAKRKPIPALVAGIGLAWLMASDARERHGYGTETTTRGNSLPWSSTDEFDRHLELVDSNVTRTHGEAESAFSDRLHDARGKALGVMRSAQDTSSTYAARIADVISSTKSSISASAQGLGDRMHGMHQGLASGAHSLADNARGLQDSLSSGARNASGQLAHGRQALRGTGDEMLSRVLESPVMLGALGLGVGALLGALVPQTDAEEQALGGMAGQARTALRDVAQETLNRGSAAAQQALQAGRDSAQAHGLMGQQDLGSLAKQAGSGQLSGAAAEVAGDVLKAVDGALHGKQEPSSKG